MMNSLTLPSPAKINLLLKIVGRRDDGYHAMVTLFHRVSLVDTLLLKKKSPGYFRLSCSDPRVPTDETNLIARAYKLLSREIPNLSGVEIHLKKKIPMGAGLGGGSSNAAFFLLGMKKLYGLRISNKKLISIGKALGADVPFFLADVNQAIGFGRGDDIVKQPISSKIWFVLALSKNGLKTKAVFKKLPQKLPRASLTKIKSTATLLSKFMESKDLRQLTLLLENDLETPAFLIRPSLRKIIKNFQLQGMMATRMSGSGATIFSICPGRKAAQMLAKLMRQKMPQTQFVVCYTI